MKGKHGRNANCWRSTSSSAPNPNNSELKVGDIYCKTDDEEKQFLKDQLTAIKGRLTTKPFAFTHNYLEETLMSIIPTLHSDNNRTTCVIQLVNYIPDVKLVNYKEFLFCGSSIEGLKLGGDDNIRCFKGGPNSCQVLCTWEINPSHRLAVKCAVSATGEVMLGLGFIISNAPINQDLMDYTGMNATSEFNFMQEWTQAPVTLLARLNNFIAIANLSAGPHSVLEVEIVKIPDDPSFEIPGRSLVNGDKDGPPLKNENVGEALKNQTHGLPKNEEPSLFPPFGLSCITEDVVCIVEIQNDLIVSLQESGNFTVGFYDNCSYRSDFQPTTVLPASSRSFFCGANSRELGGQFNYKIESTDLQFSVGFKISEQGKDNVFTLEFSRFVQYVFPHKLSFSFSPWQIFKHRKCGYASNGELMIENRNVRVFATMTPKGCKVVLKVHVKTF